MASDGSVNPDAWEAAYQRFETPEEETRKFVRRLRHLGALTWPRDAEIVELFCGRGNGLRALEQLGFSELEGIDLSPTLAARYSGPAKLHVADCRELPFEDGSRDIAIVQGGLHHLPDLDGDLAQTLSEAHRVLKPGGRFVAVEPWLTPFLRTVHAVSSMRLARMLSPKVDAFAEMFEHERRTYLQWLGQPELILEKLKQRFKVERCETRWGKLAFVGRKA